MDAGRVGFVSDPITVTDNSFKDYQEAITWQNEGCLAMTVDLIANQLFLSVFIGDPKHLTWKELLTEVSDLSDNHQIIIFVKVDRLIVEKVYSKKVNVVVDVIVRIVDDVSTGDFDILDPSSSLSNVLIII